MSESVGYPLGVGERAEGKAPLKLPGVFEYFNGLAIGCR